MRRFRTHLERLEASLALPQMQRAHVVEELAADLEDLFRRLRADGVPPEEAERRALALLFPDDHVARDLEAVHRPVWRRLLDRFDTTARSRIERAAVVLLTGAAIGFVLWGLPLSELLLDPSPFLVPVLAVGCGGLALAMVIAARLFVRGVDSVEDGTWGLDIVLFCTVAAPLLGLTGLLVDVHIAAGHISDDPSLATALLTRLMRTTGTLLAGALSLSLVTALCWLLLRGRIAALRAAAGALRRQPRLTLHLAPHERDVA